MTETNGYANVIQLNDKPDSAGLQGHLSAPGVDISLTGLTTAVIAVVAILGLIYLAIKLAKIAERAMDSITNPNRKR